MKSATRRGGLRLSASLAVMTALIPSLGYSSDGRNLAIEEVTVTAQKREQNAMDVPIAVGTFSAADMETTGALVLADMDDYIPGFEAGSGLTQSSLTVRGVSSPNISSGGDPSVATFYDGVYMPRATTTIPFSDMQSVEVLKGPQGTLAGRNAAAGSINLLPNAPSQDGFEGFLKAKVGNYDFQRLEGMVNIPLSDTVAIRANILANERDGYVDNKLSGGADIGSEDSISGRLAVLWDITSKTSLQLAYDYDDTDNGPAAQMAVGQHAYSGFDPYTRNTESDVIDGEETRDMYGFTGKLMHEFNDNWSAKLTASYRDYETTNRQDEDGTGDFTRYLDTDNIEDSDITYAELQVTYSDERVNWIMGANYSEEDIHQITEINSNTDSVMRAVTGIATGDQTLRDAIYLGAGGGAAGDAALAMLDGIDHLWDPGALATMDALLGAPGLPTHNHLAVALSTPQIFGPEFAGLTWTEVVENKGEFESWGIYTDIDFAVTDKFNLIAGLRYSEDEKDYSWYTPLNGAADTINSDATRQAFGLSLGNIIRRPRVDGVLKTGEVLSASDDWNETTGRLVGKYQINDNLMTYLSYSTGYKSGAFDGFDTQTSVDSLDPEESKNLEWGIKGDFFEGSLRAQLNVFRMELDNRQEAVETIQHPDDFFPLPTVISVDEEYTGYELTLDWLVSDSVKLGLITTERDKEYTPESYIGSDGNTVSDDTVDTDSATEYTLIMDWNPEIGFGDLFVHVDYVFREDVSEDEVGFVPAYAQGIDDFGDDHKILNARIAWYSPDDKYELAIWGKNLLDNDYVTAPGGRTASIFGTPVLTVSDPLTWGIDARINF